VEGELRSRENQDLKYLEQMKGNNKKNHLLGI
jgi:hypothetical protein